MTHHNEQQPGDDGATRGVGGITEPGVYAIPAADYHRDPCPEPSLSAGMINDLLVAPALCFANSSRLNPEWEEEEDDKFTLGSVRHILFLEPELFAEKVAVCEFDNWRKKAAKEAKAEAKEQGRTPILAKHMEKVEAARAAFLAHPFTSRAFEGGRFEQSMFWRHPVYGFWCRARPDFTADSGTHLNDYKATASADPERFGKHAYDMGYHRRAAWYLDGYEILTGKRPDHYWFCNQEVKAPYLTSVVELDMQALEAGRVENDKAARLFAGCLQSGDWFGYRHPQDLTRDLAFTVGLPTYALMQIDGRT
jgi:hypothetical protein